MQVLVLLLVITLVYIATKHFRSRRTLLTAIVCGTMLVAAISLLCSLTIHTSAPGNFRYMTPWTRDLNFGAAILDMGLWALLIGSQRKDRKLLLVTGALGIQFTGAAIGQALRDMSPEIVALAGDFVVLTNLARLYIWWQAFREAHAACSANSALQMKNSHAISHGCFRVILEVTAWLARLGPGYCLATAVVDVVG